MRAGINIGNRAKILFFCILGLLGLILVLWLIIKSFSSNKKDLLGSSHTVSARQIIVPTQEPLLTPKIESSSISNWKKFVFSYLGSQYSFEYPSAWTVVEIGHNNIVRLNFAGHCRVEFSKNSSSEVISTDDQTRESKSYAGRTFLMTTLKENHIPISESFSLSSVSSKDGFSMVTVDLPSTNISQCQQTVDNILSSVTFGH